MTSRGARASRAGACALLALGAVGVSVGAPLEPARSAATATPSPARLQPARPYWIELTTAQREALAPLSQDWERLDLQTKMKWVEIANRYPRMNPDEQARTQQRMREWALLTPDQRRVARDSFARIRQMNPEQRADLLRKYRELPAEKRQALVTQGQANKAIVVPKPPTTPVPRRTELNEGAKVRNPAIAAQKAASPLVAPARPAARAVLPAATGSATGTPPAAGSVPVAPAVAPAPAASTPAP